MTDSPAPLRFAILGCGRMGRMHIERLETDGRGRAVALFDTQPDAVESLRSELAPDARVFTNIEDLLNRADADAAIIGTPTALHFDHIRACRARGWHVLSEKPLADRREHLLTLIDESRRGTILSVAYQRRTWPVYRVLRDEIQSGRWVQYEPSRRSTRNAGNKRLAERGVTTRPSIWGGSLAMPAATKLTSCSF